MCGYWICRFDFLLNVYVDLNRPNPSNGTRVRLLSAIVLTACIVPIWMHNRDILRDFFDYSILIAAAGKIEAGLKPFTGVRSPMQSSVYLFNYASELVAGRSYLGLTWGGLAQALGGGWLILALVGRKLGGWGAFVTALAITLAGSLQHVLFFYNPIGIICYSVVLLGMAMNPRLDLGRSWRGYAVLAALFVGGINKLNFQGAALVLGGMLALWACVGRRITPAGLARSWGLMALFGVGMPIFFELWWTGASLRQWLDNVVLLPTVRQTGLTRIFDPGIYLHPVHDFHHHLLVPAIGGIGLLLLGGCGFRLGWWDGTRAWGARLVAVGLLVVGALMGGLLMLTNNESVLLTSLAYPVLAMAIYLFQRENRPAADPWLGRMVMAAMMLWAGVGGYAAWHGSRVLYAQNPPPRSAYVRVEVNTGPLAFFNGVRMLPEQREAYEWVAARLETFKDADGRLTGVLFGPGFEWMERIYPESIVPLAPVWYHAGTSLTEGDQEYFQRLLAGGRSRLVTQKGWEEWPASIRQWLRTAYRAEYVGSRDVIYHPRLPMAPEPTAAGDLNVTTAEFRATESNVMLPATRITDNLKLYRTEAGSIFGAYFSNSWAWPMGARSFQGRAVAQLKGAAVGVHHVTFRVMAGHAETGELLWEAPVVLTPQRPRASLAFALQAGGRPVWLQALVGENSAEQVLAGWREVRITEAGEAESTPALPFNRKLELRANLSTGPGPNQLWFGRGSARQSANGWSLVPAEFWRKQASSSSRLEVTFEFEANPSAPADPVVVGLVWYRAGRIELMTEQSFDLRNVGRTTLRAWLPEPNGWVGLIARPAGGDGVGHRVRIVSWTMQ